MGGRGQFVGRYGLEKSGRVDAHSAENPLRRHPILSYFVLTYAVSWLGALLVTAPHLVRHERLLQFTGILMFPVMLLGPSVVGLMLTPIVDGKAGWRELLS